ncbi:hypothetical protein [Undibacterium sp.]|jgi:hypothetical protein|uniref:hypothetical protein n=1 Tax=Undibacterium sp. TaxID=1914977 RepID=UPI002C34B556|nr:hypothetical protein [Undibacterium sp.]HTD05875.1 hypothetical protein [Undibacterium sp.]
MSDAIQKLGAVLAAKQQPTYDDVEAALAEALKDSAAYRGMLKEMASWMAKLTAAHIANDSETVTNTLDAFIAERVKIIPLQPGAIH